MEAKYAPSPVASSTMTGGVRAREAASLRGRKRPMRKAETALVMARSPVSATGAKPSAIHTMR